jgi:hypothetical protein
MTRLIKHSDELVRSSGALALANESMPDFDKFHEAEILAWELRISGDLGEDEIQQRVELLDSQHSVRIKIYSSLLLAADEVVDHRGPIRYRTKPPWGRAT